MALLVTPTPGNGARVECSFCAEGLTLSGFAMGDVKAAVEVVNLEHRCAA